MNRSEGRPHCDRFCQQLPAGTTAASHRATTVPTINSSVAMTAAVQWKSPPLSPSATAHSRQPRQATAKALRNISLSSIDRTSSSLATAACSRTGACGNSLLRITAPICRCQLLYRRSRPRRLLTTSPLHIGGGLPLSSLHLSTMLHATSRHHATLAPSLLHPCPIPPPLLQPPVQPPPPLQPLSLPPSA